MKRLLPFLVSIVLVACVDRTGLSAQTKRLPKGNPAAAVHVAEFADLQCPACRAAHTRVVQPLLEKYGSQIRYDFVHFPLQSLHRSALPLAEAAECAADQGKFWEFVDIQFARQEELEPGGVAQVGQKEITAWAESLGFDMDLFRRCTKSNIKRKTILEDYREGSDAGVSGTPTFFVNGKKVASNLEVLGAAIEEEVRGTMQKL